MRLLRQASGLALLQGLIWIGDRFRPVVSCCWRRGLYRPRGGLNVVWVRWDLSGGGGGRAALEKK